MVPVSQFVVLRTNDQSSGRLVHSAIQHTRVSGEKNAPEREREGEKKDLGEVLKSVLRHTVSHATGKA